MRITVIHNPAAGEGVITRELLCAELRAAGHEPVYASTRDDDWPAAVQEADDAVLAVGGDGTVAKAARHLIERNVPLAVLPFGTANNIAQTLGIRGAWRDLVQELHGWRSQPFDAGIAAGPWGEVTFLEGVGFGLFADTMAEARLAPTEVAATLGRDVELVTDVARVRSLLPQVAPRPLRLRLDDRVVEAETLLVAIMNITAVGPRLRLAPTARPDDGLLHVVIAREEHRASLDAYLEARLEDEPATLHLEEHIARSVEVRCTGDRLHIDDDVIDGDGPATVDCRILPGAIRVLVPPST
jgi:diacylglycerol kinase (ATP)